jgi:hypothetical protein
MDAIGTNLVPTPTPLRDPGGSLHLVKLRGTALVGVLLKALQAGLRLLQA